MDTPDVAHLAAVLERHDADATSRAVSEMMQVGHSDTALDALAADAASNPTALNALVETLDSSGVLHRFAGAMLLDRAAIDDVVQDSLISIVESIGGFTGGSKFTTWAHAIVKRRVADYLRRQRETAQLDEIDSPTVRMSSVIATRASLEDSLSRLPELYREPVVLRDIQGLPYADVAEKLGRSLGTVKSQISRGRAMMAGVLRTSAGEDGV